MPNVTFENRTNTQITKCTDPSHNYATENVLENKNLKLYYDRTIMTDATIQAIKPTKILE